MAIEYVDSTQLDSDLTSVANAIRAKSGGSSQLAFPSGFVSEIGNIPSGGGKQPVTGSFTIASIANNNAPTITHNLGTTKIAVIIYPVSIIATGGYKMFYVAYINVPELVDAGEWSLDFTSYNSTKFPEVVTVDPRQGTGIRDVSRQSSPWTTQNSWCDANNESTFNAQAVLTENTARFLTGSQWAKGSYKYIVYDLS